MNLYTLHRRMQIVVKIIFHDDGEKNISPGWCYITNWGDAQRTLCNGEVFGEGEGNAKFKIKPGKVTCKRCKTIINKIKMAII